jgi:hypothetical protein
MTFKKRLSNETFWIPISVGEFEDRKWATNVMFEAAAKCVFLIFDLT